MDFTAFTLVRLGGGRSHALARRLQRLGWAISAFDSTGQALNRLRAMPAKRARPALVIARESASVRPDDLAHMAAMLPFTARCVLAVALGSPALTQAHRWPQVQVQALPFCPAALGTWTADAADVADMPSGLTQPVPLSMEQRPTLLIADDNEVNRVVVAALAETLGCETRTACDGSDAIESCLEMAPDILLMDLEMPGVGGIEATLRLRRLQALGVIAPFPIVAATALVSDGVRSRCLAAGMDGFLVKPLSRVLLRQELQRLLPRHAAYS